MHRWNCTTFRPLTAPQRWLLARHQRCVDEVNTSLDRYDFAAAAQATYRFFWSEYCDWGLEMEKERLRSADASVAEDAANVLAWILERTLRLLHPVMPFVTEEIWQRFGVGETIVKAAWPDEEAFADPGDDYLFVLDGTGDVTEPTLVVTVTGPFFAPAPTRAYSATSEPTTYSDAGTPPMDTPAVATDRSARLPASAP